MGSRRRGSSASRCPRCRINHHLCFCEYLTVLDIKTPVHVIMHYREENLTSNTSHLMGQLHQNCSIVHRGKRGEAIDYPSLLNESTYAPHFLFPHENAIPLSEDYLKTLQKPIKLIVPDGSWRQAKKFKRRIPELSHIPCIKLPRQVASLYSVRKAPQEGMLSTFEAISCALGILEGEKIENELRKVFNIMIDRIQVSRIGKKKL